MANNYIDKIEVNGEVRDIQDAGARQSLKNAVNPNLLINYDFRSGCLVDQRQGYLVYDGAPLYTDATCTTPTGGIVMYGPYVATQISDICVSFTSTETFYCKIGDTGVVRGYTGTSYGIDMWKTEGSGTVTITDEGITLQKASGAEYFVFETFLERSRVNAADEVSLSVLTDSALHTLASTIQAGIIVVSLTANINDRFEIYDVDALPSVHIARFVIVSDTPILLRATKLELGDTQTLAHQDSEGNWVLNEVPSYADTLAKCRYYANRLDAVWATTGGASTPFLITTLNFAMRVAPAVVVGAFEDSAGVGISGLSVVSTQTTPTGMLIVQLSQSYPPGTWIKLKDVFLSAEL